MQATLVYRINTITVYTADAIYVLSNLNISNMAGIGSLINFSETLLVSLPAALREAQRAGS